jgi:hypothetical protein
LPSVVVSVNSLCLSDGDKTPNLSDHCLAYGFIFDRLSHLRSLSLVDVNELNIHTLDMATVAHHTKLCKFSRQKIIFNLFFFLTHASIIRMVIKTTTRRMICTCSIRSSFPFTMYHLPITAEPTNNTSIATTITGLPHGRLLGF